MPTLGEVLRAARAQLESISPSASLDAQLLMAKVLGVSRAHVLAHPERPLSDEEHARFTALIHRRLKGEPVAYLLGRRAFYDREFTVTPAVLIPRPETEDLLERALASPQAARPGGVAVDVGTGSGALAVTFAALRPHMQVYATDISPEALAVARLNAEQHGAAVTFFEGDLLAPFIEHGLQVDLIMANLPYIDSAVVPTLEVSQHEPVLALDGGPDGLELVRRLLEQAPSVIRPGGLMLLEIGYDQGARTAALVQQTFPYAHVAVIPDLAGLDRVVKVNL
ncbi:MAG: peptide chain release factor N(5)-glutamine methyltransferase [Anaerolineae bacterium]|jgi:release factor glutamine methyltransferase|nr:peptide chain release factor N(5)-glutamine methyltransferase [Anaerolineae bacterium]